MMGDFKKLKGLKNLNLEEIALEDVTRKINADMGVIQSANEEIRERNERQERREIERNEYLKKIEENTKFLVDIHLIISENNDKQDEILNIIKESLDMLKAKDQKEAESMYRNVMNKAKNVVDDAETLHKLFIKIKGIFDMVSKLL